MSKKVFYRQCRLVRPIPTGEHVVISWIPDQFAVKNRIVKLKGDRGEWTDGWRVVEVGYHRLPANEVPDFHELSKAHLRATGDA
jgi:hypothetical protein